MRAAATLLCLAAALGAPRLAQAHEGGLQAAVRLVGEGDYPAALEAASAESEPLARAQAELYVLHQGGDLRRALRVGLEGLEDHPDDLWLLDQTAYLALSLGVGGLAEDLYLHLEELSSVDAWRRYEPLLQEARDVKSQHAATEAALSRSRSAVIAGVLALLSPVLIAFFLGRSASTDSTE